MKTGIYKITLPKEKTSVLFLQLAALANQGKWLVVEPMYCSFDTEDEYRKHRFSGPKNGDVEAFIFSNSEFHAALQEQKLGLDDWVEVYYFEEEHEVSTDLTILGDARCSLVILCIDGSKTWFSSSVIDAFAEAILCASSDFTEEKTWWPVATPFYPMQTKIASSDNG